MKKIFFFLLLSITITNIYCHCESQVFDRPLIFSLKADFRISPISAGAIIRITSSNVIIDFNGFILTQLNTVAGFDAIVIEENVTNVTLLNLKIESVTGLGIRIKDGCQKIRIKNATIFSANAGGILLDGSSTGTGIADILLQDSLVDSCTGSGSDAFGLSIRNSQRISVRKSRFSRNDSSSSNNGFGIHAVSSSFLKFDHCDADNNGGLAIGAGIFLSLCTDCLLHRCKATDNIARASGTSNAAGFLFDQCNRIISTHCLSTHNTNAEEGAFGFLADSGGNNSFHRCIAENNSGGAECAGFKLISEDNTNISNCFSQLNEAVSSGTAYGIYLSGSANNHCSITENIITSNIGTSTSRGIVDDRASSTSLVIRNQAFNNGTNYSVTYPLTITLPTIVGSLSSAVPGLPALAAGDLDNIDVNP